VQKHVNYLKDAVTDWLTAAPHAVSSSSASHLAMSSTEVCWRLRHTHLSTTPSSRWILHSSDTYNTRTSAYRTVPLTIHTQRVYF